MTNELTNLEKKFANRVLYELGKYNKFTSINQIVLLTLIVQEELLTHNILILKQDVYIKKSTPRCDSLYNYFSYFNEDDKPRFDIVKAWQRQNSGYNGTIKGLNNKIVTHTIQDVINKTKHFKYNDLTVYYRANSKIYKTLKNKHNQTFCFKTYSEREQKKQRFVQEIKKRMKNR